MKKALLGGGLSIADQAINSVSNFLTMVIVARALTPEDTGSYAVILTTIMVLSGLQNSLIAGPLRIYGIKLDISSIQGYLRNQFTLQMCCSAVLALSLVLIMLSVPDVDPQTAIVVGLALITLQAHEFVRAAYLTSLEFRPLLVVDILSHGVRLTVLYTIWRAEMISVTNVYAVLAISSSLSLVYFVSHKKLFGTIVDLKETIRENWQYGRWVLIETIAFTLSVQFYIYLIAIILTKEEVAGFNIVQNLLNVLNIFLMGGASYAVTISRRKLLFQGYREWKYFLVYSGVILFIIAVITVIVLSLNSRLLIQFIYGDYYVAFSHLIPILGISYCLLALTTMLSAAFRTAELPQIGLVAKILSALFTVVFSTMLLKKWGVEGAAYGIVATQLSWLAVYVYYIYKGMLSEQRLAGILNTAGNGSLRKGAI